MKVEQFLNQFHFTSMAEARRVIRQQAVRVNDVILSTADLEKDANQVFKVGDTIKIGRNSYTVREDHLK